MRRLFSAFVAIVIVLCWAAAARADTTGLVRGTVTIDGKPAAGAALTLRGEGTLATARSGKDGAFVFPRIAFGRYTLTAHVAGQTDLVREVEVQTDAIDTLALDFRPLAVIGNTQTGLVRGVAGEPVAVNTLNRAEIATQPNNQSLDKLLGTLPGIVNFSYNEPVANGFHGLTYEIDGVPLPQGTASNFSEIIDPRTIDSLEVLTGAFPAEYGGYRQGAVVNIISHRYSELPYDEQGYLTGGGGTYASAQSSLGEALQIGHSTQLYLNANTQRTDRGLDSPTFDPDHDNGSQSDQFLRIISKLSPRDTLAIDVSNNFSGFQIPINTVTTELSPVAVPPGTDDVQLENTSFANLVYTIDSKDGNSFTQIAPWYKYDRIRYLGDLDSDLEGTFTDYTQTPPAVTPLDGLRQDRRSTFVGLRLDQFHAYGANAVKYGVDASNEYFSGNEQIAYYNSDNERQEFFDNSNQKGSIFGAYVQDKWTPTHYISVQGGLRYDHSTGYVGGSQLSPRFEVDVQINPSSIFHAYYGRIYAAPFLEDTRRAAVVIGGGNPDELPVYDLQPERDTYYEFGLSHEFAPGARAYVNVWKRNAENVLDTTQIFPTPIFAVYNNTVGVAQGVEGRVTSSWRNGDSFFTSASLSEALAAGISGGTFLFCPTPSTACAAGLTDLTLEPEDHDQTFAMTVSYTHRMLADKSFYITFAPQYGTGYPVEFQNGPARLAPHLTYNAAIGREVKRGSHPALGFTANLENITNNAYLLKVNNGFNTTQWAQGFRGTFLVTAPF